MTIATILLLPEQAAAIKTALVVVHLVGLVLGLGAATLLDLLLIRFVVGRKVLEEHAHIVEFSSQIVTAGLVLLWLSGIGFLVHYDLFDPGKLANQKLWAKITIVAVLSLNGVYIHRAVLPLLRRHIGQRFIEGLTASQRARLLASGAISVTSWYVPLLLGAIPQLNFTVQAATILAVYAVLLLGGITVTRAIGTSILHRLTTVTLHRNEYEALLDRLEQQESAPTPAVLGYFPKKA